MISASVCLALDMILPLSEVRNHTQFCADLGEQVNTVTTQYAKPYQSCYGVTGETQYYSGTGANRTLLKTVTNTYQDLPDPYPGDLGGFAIDPQLLLSSTTQWANGQESKITNTYDCGYFSFTDTNPGGPYTYTSTCPAPSANPTYGLVTSETQYDYGNNAAGPPLSTTNTTYKALSNSSYLSANLLDLVLSKVVTDGNGNYCSETDYAYDEYSPDASNPRVTEQHGSAPFSVLGNLTSVTGQLFTNPCASPTPSKTPLKTAIHVYDTGLTHTSIDPLNNTTATFTYSGTYYGAYPTSRCNALNQCMTYGYDFNTGLMTSMVDPNTQPTSFPSYDSMLRPTQANYPDGGQTTIAYNYSGNVFVGDTVTKRITPSLNMVTTQIFDGLGRPKQTMATVPTLTCTSGFSYLDTTYDADGRTFSVSNPYCTTGDAIYGLTKTYYDALNRVTSVVEQDGSTVSTSHTGNCATVTDEAQKTRTSCVDGMGRMTSVLEDPGSSPHLSYLTGYTYDALDDLLSVTQSGSRQRTFYYDSLSRLEKAINPESGTTCYALYSGGSCQYASASGYDANGNLLTKTDARGITTTYTYDGLNRLLTKTYSDGTPSAIYAYDQTAPWGFTLLNPIGRLTTSGTNNGGWLAAEVLSYDPLGRVSLNQQCTTCSRGWSFSMGYSYDYLGDITSHDNGAYTVGQGVTFTQTFDTAGRQTSLTSTYSDSQHPATLATVTSYLPPGEIGKMTYGNGVLESSVYESRLQPCRVTLYLSGTPTSACTKSLPSGNIQDFGFAYGTLGSTNSGNVTYWEAFGNQGFTRTYSYDSVNRLSSLSDGVTTNPCPGLSWTYDAWGNRTAQTVTLGSCGSSSLGYNGSNQITNSGIVYDAAGNMTHDGSHVYTYDAENRITAVDGGSTASYVYNAHGQRVLRTSGGVTTEYYHDLSGNVLGEAQGTTVTTGYIYLNQQLLAEYTGGTTYFIHQDHLGSTRLMTNINGCVADSLDYLPYGERNSVGSVPCTAADTTHKFTGKERDSESNLDNFGARYDSSQYGRFMTPDPVLATDLHVVDPQRWNKYSYGVNNPISYVDPDGRDAIAVTFSKEIPLVGHEGVISVEADGTATYGRWGPNPAGFPAAPGESQSAPLPTIVEFGPDGLPTPFSYAALARDVAKIENNQDPNSVQMNYFKTSDANTLALKSYIEQKQHYLYVFCLMSHNCTGYTVTGLVNGGALSAQQANDVSLVPNFLYSDLLGIAADSYMVTPGQSVPTAEVCGGIMGQAANCEEYYPEYNDDNE